jgi:hypothetical protein
MRLEPGDIIYVGRLSNAAVETLYEVLGTDEVTVYAGDGAATSLGDYIVVSTFTGGTTADHDYIVSFTPSNGDMINGIFVHVTKGDDNGAADLIAYVQVTDGTRVFGSDSVTLTKETGNAWGGYLKCDFPALNQGFTVKVVITSSEWLEDDVVRVSLGTIPLISNIVETASYVVLTPLVYGDTPGVSEVTLYPGDKYIVQRGGEFDVVAYGQAAFTLTPSV